MKNVAILIDAENICIDIIDGALSDLKQFGSVRIKRIYGDFSKTQLQKWKDIAFKYNFETIHHFSCTKNSSDILLSIDAVDILYSHQDIDTFCLFSSDSDFSSLVQRLRKSQKQVIGIGHIPPNESYRHLFEKFLLIPHSTKIPQNTVSKVKEKESKTKNAELEDVLTAYKKSKKDNEGYAKQSNFASFLAEKTRKKYGKFSNFLKNCQYIDLIPDSKKGEHKIKPKKAFFAH
ncbi:NYN domain-containing protein [Ursidibacter maritimus]|uniref:NYN domain-containing protein n=1 Tax=Ursidibacter maritimus TaxID=1331689 RepID=A0A949T558_9PAST|nr:NYN domain-containing protein [Ursidibacter maritimus]KAE9540195.1 hypothetical protein A1D26_03235 [Ursidibacter maritimus]MBV6524339.1 NYN domain-containing protein [Ursidibacter maritimus]MBV6526381.1 NYN domain-containing protein [Ursidibacter maritimus]MBV6527888.1 NYN domain-containing protein [Ursidibacter maritimus]MBV6529159.1 NYN domain-containing protein [Ursidibacter maritimus]